MIRTYKFILVVCALFFANHLFAQDVQIWSDRDIDGTARYIGLGGAMTAVGGDPTAVSDNPAALGIYRRSEVLVSFSLLNDFNRQKSADNGKTTLDLTCNQASFVYSRGNDNKERGVIHTNVMLSYNRVKTFRNTYQGVFSGKPSTLPTFLANKTNGLHESSLQPETRWGDENVGWLSLLGYDSHLINPASEKEWNPAMTDLSKNTLKVEEKGEIDDLNFDWAINGNNLFYLGIGLKVRTISYRKELYYKEEAENYNSVLTSSLLTKGTLVSGSLGFIFQPVRFMRFGMSIQSPSTSKLRITTFGNMSSSFNNDTIHITPEDGPSEYSDYTFPYRITSGIALLYGKKGLLSLEYDYENWINMSATHLFKMGLEYIAFDEVFFNLGFAYGSYLLKNEPTYVFSETTTRTDPDYRNLKYRYYISGGFGYRGKYCITQLVYQYMGQKVNFYANEFQKDPYSMSGMSHRVVLTLGLHTTR